MADFRVTRFGTDTSGRGIYFTRYAWSVWQAVLKQPEIEPFAWKIVIVQGAFMLRAGGGASASAGFHDLGGCWDIRTWNLTRREIDLLIRALRRAGIAAWRRDKSWLHGGMDPHIHVTMGADKPLSAGARDSWNQYLNNQNGLRSRRPDYEWRPSPLVTFPPASLFKEEDYMATPAAERKLNEVLAGIDDLKGLVEATASEEEKRDAHDRAKQTQRYRWERDRQAKQYSDLVTAIGEGADRLEGEDREQVLQILRDQKAVTGVDNPAPKEES